MRCKSVPGRDRNRWFGVVGILLAFATAVGARDTPDYRTQAAKECPQHAVDAHVREQIALYGPRSTDREYFGFVFVADDEIRSAVVQGTGCAHSNTCAVDTSKAVPLIPKGARILGEWHTHPQSSGAGTLSLEDVRGARGNRHIHCYGAYYSQPDGKIYAWDPAQVLVPTAMASLVLIGTYNRSARKSGDPMPFYEYQCPHCGYDEEVLQKINDKPLTKCPSCGKKGLKKLMSAPVFRLKGSGWYETDFKGDKENKRNLAGADKEEPKAESKPEPAKTEAAKVETPKAEAAKPEKASKSASKPVAKRAKPKAKPARKARR